jgi:hypothetical protein
VQAGSMIIGFSTVPRNVTESSSVRTGTCCEKPMIIEPACTVLLGRQDIHVTKP